MAEKPEAAPDTLATAQLIICPDSPHHTLFIVLDIVGQFGPQIKPRPMFHKIHRSRKTVEVRAVANNAIGQDKRIELNRRGRVGGND